jgi:hypothetical protein
MKGFMALVALAALLLAGYNWWQIRSLREDFARLEQNVQEQQKGGLTGQVVAGATLALAKAREALSHLDTDKALAALQDAQKKLSEAARTAGQAAAPYVKKLEDEASDLGRQIQDRMRSNR